MDNDGLGEILVFRSFRDSARLYTGMVQCYEHNGDLKWTSEKLINSFYMGLADFNEDGLAEVYYDNKIINGQTGVTLATLDIPYESYARQDLIVADFLDSTDACPDCAGLEIAVQGNRVYAIDINNNQTRLVDSMPDLPVGFLNSFADINVDGNLDIVAISLIDTSNSFNFVMYSWTPATHTLLGIYDFIDFKGGKPTLTNVDDDDFLEIGISGRTSYRMFDYNGNPNPERAFTRKWKHSISDRSSGETVATAFDFNCDGKKEIVYRDEDSLYIWNSLTGETMASKQCLSGTRSEYPIIVDVNNDNHADIICDCSDSVQLQVVLGFDDLKTNIMAFTSSENNWANTRRVHNQYNYNAVNINDDLSIPKVQQFPAHQNLPQLNGFLNQPSLSDTFNNPFCFVKIPDAIISIDSLEQGGCNQILHLTICNLDSSILLAPRFKYSIYDNSNRETSSLIIDTFTTRPIFPDSCESFSIALPSGFEYTLYAVITDTVNDCYEHNNIDTIFHPSDYDFNNTPVSSQSITISEGSCVRYSSLVDSIIPFAIKFGKIITPFTPELLKDSICPDAQLTNLQLYFKESDTFCIYSSEVNIIVSNSFFNIPNVFSPNGDGLNDMFNIYTLNVTDIENLTISNRWGDIIHQYSGPLNDYNGWDGKHNGIPTEIGVYLITIAATTNLGEKIIYTDKITLLK